MKIDKRILNPDRNKTSSLWRRLESGTIMPVLLVAVAISVANIQKMNGSSSVEAIIMFAFLILLSAGSMISQKKIVNELKKRYEETSNNDLKLTK